MHKSALLISALLALPFGAQAHTYKCKDSRGEWTEEACPDYEQRKRQSAQKLLEEQARKNWTPRVGMASDEVEKMLRSPDCHSTRAYKWCGSWKINRTKTAFGTREQRVFTNARGMPLYFLFFDNGVLVTIQD